MRHRLICGPSYAAVEIELSPGEELVAEAGAMAWMDDSIRVRTEARGGLLKGIGRKFTGESFFQNTYYVEGAAGQIALAPGVPGDIIPYEMQNEVLIMERGAYLGHIGDIETSVSFEGFRGVFAEGLLALQVTGTGLLFFNAYGDVQEIAVDGNYTVDSGYAVAWQASLDYSIGRTGRSISSFLFGDQLISRYHGKGKLWVQTRSPRTLASWIHPFRRVKSNTPNQ